MAYQIPYCHGERMQPVTRYKSNGVVYRIFVCNAPGCQNKVEVEWDD